MQSADLFLLTLSSQPSSWTVADARPVTDPRLIQARDGPVRRFAKHGAGERSPPAV